jgi:hypothetical protein
MPAIALFRVPAIILWRDLNRAVGVLAFLALDGETVLS